MVQSYSGRNSSSQTSRRIRDQGVLYLAGEDPDLVTINDIACVVYSDAQQDISGVMFFHPWSQYYVFAVVGAPYFVNMDTIASILCSLNQDQI